MSETKPLRKLMIRTWRGELPEWTPKFLESVKPLEKYGWYFVVFNEWDWFRTLCQVVLDVQIPPIIDVRKPGHYDPALGEIYSSHSPESNWFKTFDFWGHFNLDCVYGRLHHFLPDEFLANIDIYANDPAAICGPFTVYRNTMEVNVLFSQTPGWKESFESPIFTGWDEIEFSKTVNTATLRGEIRFVSGFLQAHDHMTPAHFEQARFLDDSSVRPVSLQSNNALIDNVTGQEIMMYHFNQTRRWPLE